MPVRGIVVAEAVEEDVEAVATFFWAAWEEAGPQAPGWAGSTEEALKEITTRDSLLQRIGRPNGRMFLAKDSARVVGFAANRKVDDETVELAGIVVLQSLLGRGIGSRLLEAALNAARKDGYKRIIVRTEVDNERAISFYKAKGFTAGKTETEEVGGVSVEVLELSRDL